MLGFGQGDERRQALVIGNTAYAKDGELPAAVNDAKAVAEVLKRLGFQVRDDYNCDYAKTDQLFDAFNADLKKDAAKVGLLYFSGHGVQVSGKSYLMPIGAEVSGQEDFAKLIDIERQIDTMSKFVKSRIIILDACRSNPFAPRLDELALKSRGYTVVAEPRDIERTYVGGDTPVKTNGGLAEISADTGTFISFAAAPGGVAYESPGETHSKYTAALLRDIEATDLPLGNLMIRVRNNVSQSTQRLQKTWDHSSLEAPFFFNPGSLLMMIGNAMGLVASITSLLPVAFSVHAAAAASASASVASAAVGAPQRTLKQVASAAAEFPPLSSYWTILSIMISVATFGLFLVGLQRAYRLLRGEIDVEDSQSSNSLKLLSRRGFFGGFFGGITAAPIITTAYYFSATESWRLPAFGQLLVEITIVSIIIGVLLGLLALSGAERFEASRARWPEHRWITNAFTGAVVGGIIAGVICGPWVTLYFGLKFDRPLIVPHILLLGAIPGTAVIIFSILNYTLDRINLATLVKSGFASLLAVVVVGAFAGGLGLLLQDPIEGIASSVRAKPEPLRILLWGLPYGVGIGIALGAVFGFAYLWSTSGKNAVTV